jgi:hypothetical protein
MKISEGPLNAVGVHCDLYLLTAADDRSAAALVVLPCISPTLKRIEH